jgi:outer membrane protein assembly factor BamE (lipoprotein component of BamABCDE complex)
MRPSGFIGSVFGLAVLTACVPTQDTRGYMPDEDVVAQVKPGTTTKDKVYDLFGSPSSMGTFDQNVWYYIEKKTEQTAFYEPKVLDQRVLAVEFDRVGTVTAVKRWGVKDGKLVEPVARITETRGKELGFIEQMFGNIGRFNKAPGTRSSQ